MQNPRTRRFTVLPAWHIKIIFDKNSIIFKGLMPIAKSIDKGSKLKHAFAKFELLNKTALFNCMDCGDCALIDTAYICPMFAMPEKGSETDPAAAVTKAGVRFIPARSSASGCGHTAV